MSKVIAKQLRFTTKGDRVFSFFCYSFAVLMIIAIIYPLWFIVIASFSNPADIARGDVLFWPKSWSLQGYQTLFNQSYIWQGYLMTIIYTVLGTLVALVVNILPGFALSFSNLFAKKWIVIFLMVPMFISGGMIPTYFVVKQFGLIDNFWVMIVPFSVSVYNIIIARTFFQSSIPLELWDAAQLDGIGLFRYFFQIVLPLSKAIIAVIGLWSAVGIWNSWFNALIYLPKSNYLHPLQLILRNILIQNSATDKISGISGGLLAEKRKLAEMLKYSSIIVSTLPIMCLYPFLQKYFNKGVMVGSLKG